MPKRSSKRPTDPNRLAKRVVDIATDAFADHIAKQGAELEGKNPAAVALGRLGGLKGGKARAVALSSSKKRAIAKKAAAARWSKK